MKYALMLFLVCSPAFAQQDYAQNRFHMTQDGKNMTANDFDTWLQDQGLQIVNGKGVRKVVNGATSFSSLVPEASTMTTIGSGVGSRHTPQSHNTTVSAPVQRTFQGGARGRIVTFAED